MFKPSLTLTLLLCLLYDQIPDRKPLEGRGVYFVCLRDYIHHGGEGMGQWSHDVRGQGADRSGCVLCVACLLLFTGPRRWCHLVHSRWVTFFWIYPHGHAQRCVSMVSLKPIKLMMTMNQHSILGFVPQVRSIEVVNYGLVAKYLSHLSPAPS